MDYFSALILGLLEGLTEFIPVSSTAHLLLAQHFLGFRTTGNTFPVLIQLGAILAILSVYFRKLLDVALTLPSSQRSRWFVLSVLVGFLPAAVIGAIAHDFIKAVLFESPVLICYVLIAGGIVLLAVDKLKLKPRYFDAMAYPLPLSFKIGLFQCLAMIPGTSRSGATIVGALLMGTDKRSAAEYSFFLAMPTMVGAFTLDLYKTRKELSLDDGALIGIGFIAAFVMGLIVVRSLLAFVSRNGYAPFAWWRIIVGVVCLVGLYVYPEPAAVNAAQPAAAQINTAQ
jgi:undecaprenyl-diphosphatase